MTIEGPIGDMLERNKVRDTFKLPPWIAERRPFALKSGSVVALLTCADPRIDPRKIFVLDGTPGMLFVRGWQN
jgi:hypothetical protein